jgi:dethiobiotin synthetase
VIVVITGTGTEVGKTYVTAAVARALKARGMEVHARKPVQSFGPDDIGTDADVLAAATGEPVDGVCPRHRWLPIPMAPPMSADLLGLDRITINDLVAELRTPKSGITLVEGAGGLLSPIAHDGDTRTLVQACDPHTVVLVADAGLGTINLVRLSVEVLGTDHTPVVYLNRFDPLDDIHVANADWLDVQEGLEVVTDPEALCAYLMPTN